MEQKEIASILIDRRNTLAPVVMQGEMRTALGSDGYAEALRLGWIRPNLDTGELTITNQFSQLDAMRNVKEAVEIPKVGDVVTVADAGKPYNATIKTVNTDGTYELSFGTEKPAVSRRYKKDEVRVVKASDPTAPKTAADKLNATKPTVTTMGASTSLGSPGMYRAVA